MEGEGLKAKVTLNDGHKMPLFGLGTGIYLSSGEETRLKAVCFALQNGYRMIDTAMCYR